MAIALGNEIFIYGGTSKSSQDRLDEERLSLETPLHCRSAAASTRRSDGYFYSPKNIINFPNNSLTTGNVKLEPFFFDLKKICKLFFIV